MLSTEWPEGGSRGKAKSAGTEVTGMKYAFKWKKCIGIRIFIDVLHPKCGLWEIMLISEHYMTENSDLTVYINYYL